MANVENRPYAGTWKLNRRTVVKYTPDALVFVNGDTSLPGCPRCRGRIDIQRYVTALSVEAGTEPTSHSATIQLSIPRVQGEQLFVDGYNILRPGLEVHIFMRGFFPVRGMFRHLADPQAGRNILFQNPTDDDHLDLSKYATYPYYPVFHGVLTQVSYDYADGFYTGSLQCASLLHFWQYVNMTTSGAWQAMDSRPVNDTGRTTLYGHTFNNMHPFSIMYTLYRDVAGSAAGVDFALSEESNLAAVSQVAASGSAEGSQLFTQITRYWEQRFKTRVQSLRMYGTNGQLFNAAQQAWIGSADTRDGQKLLPSATFNDASGTRTERDPLATRLSVAKSLGLQGSGVDFTYSPLIQQNNELFNLSVLDLYAFNQTIAEIGTVNQWTSTHTTKMDIAQQVMQVTGYEFYQDVDGDLVFKPPFYNLDVSTNRYYRLEDSDIINISFVEKEPNYTYIIVRGAWFSGLGDVAQAEATVKRGLYIDYQLVASFGWRAAPTLELPTITDPKVLFWIGVARLDRLNVDTYSASCTIPIRAELRPGFPVYIPFVDCFYYITQFSHSFAFGGQCVTNLVLNCRRAKFHAPGFLEPAENGESAVTKIRLDRPDLPPRPLEMFVNGIPRIVGFPNVVMALDPRQFNPNFSVVGVGIDYFDQFDPAKAGDLLFSWLARDVSSLRAFEAVGYDVQPDGSQVIGDPEQVQRLRLRYSDNPDRVIEFDVQDLIRAFSDYRRAKAGVIDAENQVDMQQEEVAKATAAANAFDPSAGVGVNTTNQAIRGAHLGHLDTMEAELQGELREFRTELGQKQSLQFLVHLFEALQPDSNKPIRRKVDGIAGSDVRLSYFESLEHLKGQYLAGTAPGNYRYFSCSHPFPSQQGMPILEWDDGERTKSEERRVTRERALGRAEQAPRRQAYVGNNLFQTLSEQASTLPGIDVWMNTAFSSKASKIWQGRTEKRIAKATENMDTDTAQSLLDILTVANVIVGRIQGNSDYQEAVRDSGGRFGTIEMYSGYRPELEPDDAEAFHSMGVAIDIKFANDNFSTVSGTALAGVYGRFTDAIRAEMLTAYNEGLVQGMGFYAIRPNEGKGPPTTFIHLDRRNDTVRDGLAERRGVSREDIPARGAWAEPKIDGKTFETWETFAKRNGMSPPSWKRPSPVPGRITLSTNPDVGTPDPTDAPPVLPALAGKEEPLSRPSVTERAVSTDTRRMVVQFRPTVRVPEEGTGLRAPEVELGVGYCDQGLQIALGPQRTPRVLTTDQIQSISFVRHNVKKFASIVGPSQETGRLSFNAEQLHKQITDLLMEQAQNLDNMDQTLSDVFEDAYQEMKENLSSVPVPHYFNGIPLFQPLSFTEFPDILVVSARELPPSVLAIIRETHGDDQDWSLNTFTLGEVALIPGYSPRGTSKDDGQEGERQARVAASKYARSLTRELEAQFLEAQASADPPVKDKHERLAVIQSAFNQAVFKALGIQRAFQMITDFAVQEVAAKKGKIEKPLHSPVFPVSDEKGYEHYGAYRYGRGLSVESGGTFQYIHSGQDPFRNVTPQTAEEFLRVFTLVKEGKLDNAGFLGRALKGAQEAASKMVEFVLEQRRTPLSEDITSLPSESQTRGGAVVGAEDVVEKLGLSERERAQVEQSVVDIAHVVNELGQTSRGQDALHELLVANGDDPNILEQESFDISDTQFVRNFVNFAANYGKSPVFKTTAANAAYNLADLTSHLIARAGDACTCRGSHSDVMLAAYARSSFLAVESIDQDEDKATAFASEEIIKGAGHHSVQQLEYEGAVNVQGSTPRVDRPQSVILDPFVDHPTVSPANPPTTLNPFEGDAPSNTPEGLPSVLDLEEGPPLLPQELPSVLDEEED